MITPGLLRFSKTLVDEKQHAFPGSGPRIDENCRLALGLRPGSLKILRCSKVFLGFVLRIVESLQASKV